MRIGAEADMDLRDISATSAAGIAWVALPSTSRTVETHALKKSASSAIPPVLTAVIVIDNHIHLHAPISGSASQSPAIIVKMTFPPTNFRVAKNHRNKRLPARDNVSVNVAIYYRR